MKLLLPKTLEEKRAYKRAQAAKYRQSETGKRYRQSDEYKEIVRLGQEKYYGSEKDLTRRRRYRQTEQYKQRKSRWETVYNNSIRTQLVQLLGPRCVECGLDDIRLLDLHHIHNDGKEERKMFGYENAMWSHHTKNLDVAQTRLQVLCKNHHALKRYQFTKYIK